MGKQAIAVVGLICTVFMSFSAEAGDSCSALFAASNPSTLQTSAVLSSNSASQAAQQTTTLAQKVKSKVQAMFAPKEIRRRSVREQSSGTCWLEAGLLNVEYLTSSVKDDVPELSSSYLVAQHLKYQALEYLRHGPDASEANFDLAEGSHTSTLRRLLMLGGVVPSSEFDVGRPDWDFISQRLFQFVKEERAQVAALEGADDNESSKRRQERLDNAQRFIDAYLEKIVGAAPKAFVVAGQEWTPLTYWHHLYERMGKSLFIIPNQFDESVDLLRESWLHLDARKESFSDVMKRIKTSLAKKRTLLVVVRWASALRELEDGRLVYEPKVPVSDQDNEMHENHSMVIVGLRKVNGNEEVILQNSWSDRAGDKGFNYISPRHLFKVLLQIEDMVTTGREQNAVNKKERGTIRREMKKAKGP